jgi:hypothetical protein
MVQPEYVATEIVAEPNGNGEIPEESRNPGSTDGQDSLTPSRLFEIAVPELYEQNAFRVLGLEIDDSLRDIRRKQKKLERNERLGINSNHCGGHLPLKPTPGEDETRKALHRIQDPVARLLDEFFWFWPRQAGTQDDDVLALLRRKRVQDAHKLWLRYEGGSSSDKVSTHNLAVLYHVSALDFEQRLAREELTEEEHKTRVGCWRRAYDRWRVLLSEASFWKRVSRRILELDDPQLSPQTVEEIRHCLGKAILLIHARVAVRAAERGKLKLARQHVELMHASGSESHLVQEAIRESVKNVRQRIKMLCDAAEPKAAAAPSSAHLVTRSLLHETQPLLQVMDAMLPEYDATRLGAHDEVARTALRCQTLYVNTTDDWNGSLEILKTVFTVAGTQTMRDRLAQNIDIIKGNIEYGTCYYCGLNQAHGDAAVEVPMFGNVKRTLIESDYLTGRTRYHVTWQHATVRVPRCQECKKYHAMIEKWTIGSGLSGIALAILFFVLAYVVGGDVGTFFGFLGFILLFIGFLFGYVLGRSEVPYKMKGATDYEQFGRIEELRKQGWKNGSEPSEEEQNSAPLR